MAIGGTGSDFFSFCFQNYLPYEQPDIVLVELSVNDYGYGDAAQPMELLTRRLFLLPSRPLVMYVHFVDRGLYKDNITNTGCNNMEDLGFNKLAEHYGIPSFSWRDFVCPLTSTGKREPMNTEKDMFNNDGSHVSYKAHLQVASKIIQYLKISLAPRGAYYLTRSDVKQNDYMYTLVQPVFTKSISDDELIKSMCLSYLTPDFNVPLKQTLYVNITHSNAFRYFSPKESKKESVHFKFRTDAYGRWGSRTIGGLLKIEFGIPNGPSRSVILIFRTKDNDASTTVWLDDDQDSAITIDSNKCGHHMYQTRLQPIATTNVSPGYHTLNVQSNRRGWFEVSGLVVGYPGYHDYKGYRPFDVKAKMWNYEKFQQLQC
ncbi:hypothetical protein QZH41_002949 [Actinostola sp. cb2023]|nr:hypothetical protein QZH41_002949 [Actinostola sp. cb2023]